MGKTLVTGAAGFIGSHVVRELLKRNREVRAFVMPGENTKNIEGLDVEQMQGDVLDVDAVRRAMQGVTHVYHLAAIYALWLPRREKMYEVNCNGTMNVLWAAYKKNVERVVYTSSIAALGMQSDGSITNEATPFNMMGKGNDYVYSKWLSEEQALSFAREGLPIVICNPSGPIGPRDIGPTPTGSTIVAALNGLLRVYFDTGINMVDVEDVALGHVLAGEKGRVGEKYLLAGHNMKMKDLIHLVGNVTGVKIKARAVPLELAIPFGDLLERYADRMGKKPLVTGDSLRYMRRSMNYDNTKARTELGLEFRPLEDSIRRATRWFAENGYITNKKLLRRYQGV